MLWTSYNQSSVSLYGQWHSHVHKTVFCTSSTISCSYNLPITFVVRMRLEELCYTCPSYTNHSTVSYFLYIDHLWAYVLVSIF